MSSMPPWSRSTPGKNVRPWRSMSCAVAFVARFHAMTAIAAMVRRSRLCWHCCSIDRGRFAVGGSGIFLDQRLTLIDDDVIDMRGGIAMWHAGQWLSLGDEAVDIGGDLFLGTPLDVMADIIFLGTRVRQFAQTVLLPIHGDVLAHRGIV